MEKKKYRFCGGADYDIHIDQKPDVNLFKYITLPQNTTEDIITFGAKYVESFANLNRAWFDNQELIKAYATIPLKAVDIEHDLEKVVGHIYSHAYVDRAADKLLTPDDFLALGEDEQRTKKIDVLIGGAVYVDRFPGIESPVSTKAFKISMETYFENFDLLLENGMLLSMEEAISLGLNDFIDQLMGKFESQEEFEEAHTLKVILGAQQQNMKIYKYLRGLQFSGAGLTLGPACPSCWILATDRDEDESCSCGGKMAASTENKIKLYELDLVKTEAFKRSKKEKSNQIQVPDIEKADTVNTQVPPGGPTPDTRENDTNLTSPSICPQYKERVFEGNVDPLTGGDTPLHEHWCLFADKGCEVAGDRQDKSCFRWIKDPDGNPTDLFDTRNFMPGVGEPELDEILSDEDYNVAKQAFSNLLEYYKLTLEKIAMERAKEIEEAAQWTTQYINGLPNSSFAVVETGYKAGESSKSARHLPYKDASGKVDLPHLRNALARMNQIKSVLGNDTDEELRARAKRKLAPLAKKHFPDTTVTED